jgi:hypothetical protein
VAGVELQHRPGGGEVEAEPRREVIWEWVGCRAARPGAVLHAP